jgi:glycine/D-amino acid oxidase-like deaminating enzyme
MKQAFYLVIGCIATMALFGGALLLASRPPTDEALIMNFSRHRNTFDETARMFIADGNEAVIGMTGFVWPRETEATSITKSRIDQYRQQLTTIGASNVSGSGMPDLVAFQMHAPVQLPFGPIKSYVYSTRPPQLLTKDSTDRYIFAPSQRQRVCREIAENWYVCIDYED